MQASEAEQMQKAAAEMLAHHQQLAALEHDRHTSMLKNMQVPQSIKPPSPGRWPAKYVMAVCS